MKSPPSLSVSPYGQLPDGRRVSAYTLDSGNGMQLTMLDLGGIVTSLEVPDRTGRKGNVVLGLARLADHVEGQRNFGALVGRYANRIGRASFVLEGRTWQLDANEGSNTLHGGSSGFATQLWSVQPGPLHAERVSVVLARTSEHLEGGFPGRITVSATYTVGVDHSWRIDYTARTDRSTVVNLTHHAYFNLAGTGSALEHELMIAASNYLAVDGQLLPTRSEPVADTPFDFRSSQRLADRIRCDHPQIALARGFDHNWIIDRPANAGLVVAARLKDPASGRSMTVESTEPGLQFYSGNFLDGAVRGTAGRLYRQGDGLCLETQHFPDSPRRKDFPPVELRPGQEFQSTTIYRFGAD